MGPTGKGHLEYLGHTNYILHMMDPLIDQDYVRQEKNYYMAIFFPLRNVRVSSAYQHFFNFKSTMKSVLNICLKFSNFFLDMFSIF